MTAVAKILSSSDRLASSSARFILLLLRARAFVVLIVLLILFSVLSPSFHSLSSIAILSKHIALLAILAIGMTFVVLAGGIDLSVGSIAGLAGMVTGYLLTQGIAFGGTKHFPPLIVVLLVTIAVSLLVGAINGWLITQASVAPFIATLGTLYIARGAALLISNGKTFPGLAGTDGRHNTALTFIGQGHILGIPVPVGLALIIFAIAAVCATKTRLGRHIYGVGGNERAARLAGINISRVKMATYLFSAACAGLVGIIIASQLESAHPATGETFELNAIAAVVLGGTSLMGGRGSITGSLIGACVIGVLADGLVMLGVSEFWQMVIKGVVIVLAVAIDQFQTRLQTRLLPLILRSSPEAGA